MATKRSASLNRYLSNQSDVVNARASATANLKTFNQAKFYYESLSPSSKDFPAALANFRDAEAKQDSLQRAITDAETAATTRYETEQSSKTKSKASKETSNIEAKLNPLYVEKNAYIQQGAPVPEAINAAIKNLETQLREKGGRPTPGVTGPTGPTGPTGGTGVTGGTGPTAPVESALAEDRVAFAQKYIGNLEKTKELQQALKDANLYKGKVDGIFRADIINKALDDAESKISTYESYGITFPNRIEALKRLATDFKTGGGPGGGAGGVSLTISNPTAADALVNAAFKSELGRDATAAELQKYRKILNTAEEKNPTKTVNGRTVGGINRDQFLKTEIAKLPEFSKKKTDKASLTVQSILTTAKANGVTLADDQINSFTRQIQSGTDEKIIANQIRSIASLGMPDNVKKLLSEGIDLETVFSPYKRTMAAILELNPETIDLNDPTLRMAMGGDYSKVTSTPGMGGVSRGEYTMYDFEKALRKDYRWQYTDNAKREVSNVALKVLQDFGFQA
jgi:hypothetical protein